MKELLQEQTTADQTDNSNLKNGSDNKNWTRLQIDGTPFWVIGNDQEGYNIIMGKWKLTNEPINCYQFNDGPIIEQALTWLDENKWNTILSMIICVTTDIEKQKQN